MADRSTVNLKTTSISMIIKHEDDLLGSTHIRNAPASERSGISLPV